MRTDPSTRHAEGYFQCGSWFCVDDASAEISSLVNKLLSSSSGESPAEIDPSADPQHVNFTTAGSEFYEEQHEVTLEGFQQQALAVNHDRLEEGVIRVPDKQSREDSQCASSAESDETKNKVQNSEETAQFKKKDMDYIATEDAKAASLTSKKLNILKRDSPPKVEERVIISAEAKPGLEKSLSRKDEDAVISKDRKRILQETLSGEQKVEDHGKSWVGAASNLETPEVESLEEANAKCSKKAPLVSEARPVVMKVEKEARVEAANLKEKIVEEESRTKPDKSAAVDVKVEGESQLKEKALEAKAESLATKEKTSEPISKVKPAVTSKAGKEGEAEEEARKKPQKKAVDEAKAKGESRRNSHATKSEAGSLSATAKTKASKEAPLTVKVKPVMMSKAKEGAPTEAEPNAESEGKAKKEAATKPDKSARRLNVNTTDAANSQEAQTKTVGQANVCTQKSKEEAEAQAEARELARLNARKRAVAEAKVKAEKESLQQAKGWAGVQDHQRAQLAKKQKQQQEEQHKAASQHTKPTVAKSQQQSVAREHIVRQPGQQTGVDPRKHQQWQANQAAAVAAQRDQWMKNWHDQHRRQQQQTRHGTGIHQQNVAPSNIPNFVSDRQPQPHSGHNPLSMQNPVTRPVHAAGHGWVPHTLPTFSAATTQTTSNGGVATHQSWQGAGHSPPPPPYSHNIPTSPINVTNLEGPPQASRYQQSQAHQYHGHPASQHYRNSATAMRQGNPGAWHGTHMAGTHPSYHPVAAAMPTNSIPKHPCQNARSAPATQPMNSAYSGRVPQTFGHQPPGRTSQPYSTAATPTTESTKQRGAAQAGSQHPSTQSNGHGQWHGDQGKKPTVAGATARESQRAGNYGTPHPGQARHNPQPNIATPVSKYARMAAQHPSDQQDPITAIKRNILSSWALQPPLLQSLRPVDVLVTTIHTVFPPAYGVKGHDYFKRWTPIAAEFEGDKLKKAVRKVRFFLHPDKLPKDLDESQSFVCKMLWDITNDAWEQHLKSKDGLN